MATTYKTPGVYVEEISVFPPSVAQVATAIPAFVGYTQKAMVDGTDYHSEGIIKAIRISSLPEYEFIFGGAPDPTNITMELNTDNTVKSTTVNGINLLYDSLRMFYANGGGDCFVVSVGSYNATSGDVDKQELLDGLAVLEKEDLPTLLVIPETIHLSASESGEVHAAMLQQCNKLQDRFSVLDIVNGDKAATPSLDPIEVFRSNVGMNYLKYGAAYYPWLKTTLPYKISYNAIINGTYQKGGSPIANIKALFNSGIIATIDDKDADLGTVAAIPTTAPTSPAGTPSKTNLSTYAEEIIDYMEEFFSLSFSDNDTTNPNSSSSIHARYVKEGSIFHGLLKTFYDYLHYADSTNGGTSPWAGGLSGTYPATSAFGPLTFSVPHNTSNDIFPGTGTAAAALPYFDALHDKMDALFVEFTEDLKAAKNNTIETLSEIDPVYKAITKAIESKGVVLPPSGAMVGVYARTDNDRGVWKAPANTSINTVSGVTTLITHKDQEELNIDVTAGKSINAIRPFTGKGIMVWGARTLAGNDNEWRYISVRRFFNMAEESIKKATEQFVFEPNDKNTWVKVRAMIENFLTLQWRAGALAGAKPEQAFFVRVGLGETMTADDILNGKMNIEIGMAVVRPAEFIILKFSHKMQES